MGFKKVYKALQEIFPEVDSRALRAVAIEHQKDADAAVEVVLTEVIPFLVETSSPSKSSSGARIAGESGDAELVTNGTSEQETHLQNAVCIHEDQQSQFYDAECQHDQLFHDANGGFHQIYGDSSIGKISSIKNFDENRITICTDMSSPVASAALIHQNGAHHHHGKVFGDPESGDAILAENCGESSASVGLNQNCLITLSPLEHGNLGIDQNVNNPFHGDTTSGENYQDNISADGNVLEVVNSVGHTVPSNVENSTLSSAESSIQLVVLPDFLSTDMEIEPNDSKTAAGIESTKELICVQDESTLNTGVTQSAQICSIDLLEGIIANARNNKKTLFSAMESVISLMREVELQEKAAEQAREEAAEGGLEILKTVEDFKQMLQHAKEANDMHAGEVYGEKAILSTEVRELQSRLLSLSDERDKSLQVLDEMRQSLEVRSIAAERDREAAEKEKLEKEAIAQKALADHELVMEKVVQEANDLNKEAEENAKLRDFLVDRGRVVDMLQGEISVICHDVRLLKEKFDERLPLSKSLTSSQTSCILASSSSSSKSLVTDQADSSDPVPCFVEPQSSGADADMDDNKGLIDMGWEIFDNREPYM